MRNVAMFMLGAAVLVGAVGCPGVIGPPASAILAGDWTGTDANGVVVTVKFDADGIVVSITSEDGASAEVSNSTTDLDGSDVTIVIGGRTFSGTLSDDENTISGTVEQEITAGGGDIVITIPAGDFEINRVDLCADNTCDDGDACNGEETCDADTGDCVDGDPVVCEEEGDTCVDGVCGPPDLCDGNTCDDGDACNGEETCDPDTGGCVDGDPVVCEVEGETCVDGVCGPPDLCDGNTCDDGDACNGVETCDADTGDCVDGDPVVCEVEGDVCVDGECGPPVDPCEGVDCADCEACVDGACVPLGGDAAVGETYYSSADGGCSNCHGPDGEGPPSVIGAECSLIFDKLTGVVSHVGGTREDITGQDAADLEAWLVP